MYLSIFCSLSCLSAPFLLLGASPFLTFQCSVVRRFFLLQQMFLLVFFCVGSCCSLASVDAEFVGPQLKFLLFIVVTHWYFWFFSLLISRLLLLSLARLQQDSLSLIQLAITLISTFCTRIVPPSCLFLPESSFFDSYFPMSFVTLASPSFFFPQPALCSLKHAYLFLWGRLILSWIWHMSWLFCKGEIRSVWISLSNYLYVCFSIMCNIYINTYVYTSVMK